MNVYTVTFARSARRELESLETLAIARLLPRIEALANNPRPYGCCKIKGGKNLWRIRVGDYRIVYGIDDSQRAVDVIAIGHRRDVYR
jgi:mRNA interferase RelE/StbE